MIISSMLDTDLYVLTMCDAALQLCPDKIAEYMFVDRNDLIYDDCFLQMLKSEIKSMGSLSLQNEEYLFLKENCPFFSRGFLEYLRNFKFDPDEVVPSLDAAGHLKINVSGPIINSIWWEVPLMAVISELYFTKWNNNDKKWDYNGQVELAQKKAQRLSLTGCDWCDFGTRRRRSGYTQDIIVENMKGFKGFLGTSNPYLAMKHKVPPIGTMAHQWIQIWSALTGLRHANKFAMEAWLKVFHGDLGIVLTDTFGTDAFFKDFDGYLAKVFSGTRHDSSCPFLYAEKVVAHYNILKIDPSSKIIVFSDSLNVEKAVELQIHCDKLGIRCSFGIGTSFSNDFAGLLKALNMVIKLVRIDGIPVVKLSDVPTKAVCEDSQQGRDALRIARHIFYGSSL